MAAWSGRLNRDRQIVGWNTGSMNSAVVDVVVVRQMEKLWPERHWRGLGSQEWGGGLALRERYRSNDSLLPPQ